MIRRLSVLIMGMILGCICLSAKNTALLVGVGNYNPTATGWSVIHGNNDVTLLESKLKAKGFKVSYLMLTCSREHRALYKAVQNPELAAKSRSTQRDSRF